MKETINLILIMFLVMIMALLVSARADAQTSNEVVQAIHETAIRYQMNPELMVAIAKVESNLDPNAVGTLGEIGVFQLRPEYHSVSNDYRKNIETAIQYLATIRTKWEPVYGDAWFIKFNLGPNYRRINYPHRFTYYVKVMQKMSRTVAAQ